jgi:hypothetical protein
MSIVAISLRAYSKLDAESFGRANALENKLKDLSHGRLKLPHANIKHITKNGVTCALDAPLAAKVTLK